MTKGVNNLAIKSIGPFCVGQRCLAQLKTIILH